MGRNLVRAGGAVLAALSISAGGMGLGVGTAAADMRIGDGSSEYINQPCGEGLNIAACDDREFEPRAQAGDTFLTYRGSDRVEPGDRNEFLALFSVGELFEEVPAGASEPDLVISSVTHHAPSGFEFTGATVYANNGANRVPVPLDATVVVDPVTGDVTLTAPDGGWAIPKDDRYAHLRVGFEYSVTEVGDDRTSRIGFTGTDSTSDRWVATGNTGAYQDFMEGPFGSLAGKNIPLPNLLAGLVGS